MPLTAVARPHLEALAEATLDTIHLGVRDGDDVLYIDKIPGTRGSRCARASATGCRSRRPASARR